MFGSNGFKNQLPIEFRPVGIRVAAVIALCVFAGQASAITCSVSVANDAQIAAQNTFSSLAAGSTVCISPGTYSNALVIYNVKGTASQPVNFVVNPTGGVANFNGGVLLRTDAYVNISGLTVTMNPSTNQYAAVVLDTGTHHTSVSGFTVQSAYLGITIGSSNGAAGVGNSVLNNVVQNNWNTGIAVGGPSDGTAATLTLVQGNRVLGNGGHGIEVVDSNYIGIYQNLVSGNGTGVNANAKGGYSGIHIYATAATTASSPSGVRSTGNVVGYNTVIGTLERPATQSGCNGSLPCTDGNGIQVDMYCNNNSVLGNTVSANAGAGISIYGASGNLVYNNSAYGNNKQTSRTANFPGPGEITVSAINLPTGSASNNKIYNNLAITTVNQIPAFYQSGNAGTNTIGPNNVWWWSSLANPGTAWGPVYIGTTWYSTGAAVNTATGTAGNVVGAAPQ